jgi:putative ABC transport system permease protein
LDLFGYEFTQGSAKTSLRAPFIRGESPSRLAHKVFNNNDAVGKTIKINGNTELTISGVVKDVPENTHIQFEMLVSFSTFYKAIPENWTSNRGWMAQFTYLYIEPDQLGKVESRIPEFQTKFYEGWDNPGKTSERQKCLNCNP